MALALAPVAVAVSSALGARVRVHVVAGDDVYPDVGRRSVAVGSLPPRNGYRRLAAAVVEQADVRAAEVPIGQTVDHIVEAGLGQPDPGRVVKQPVRDAFGRSVRQDDTERQPEQHEDQEAVKVGSHQREVPRVRQVWLKVGQAHVALDVHDDPDVGEEGQQQWHQHHQSHPAGFRWNDVVRLPVAVIEANVVHKLHTRGETGHKPNQQQDHGHVSPVEPAGLVLGRTQPEVVLDGHDLEWLANID